MHIFLTDTGKKLKIEVLQFKKKVNAYEINNYLIAYSCLFVLEHFQNLHLNLVANFSLLLLLRRHTFH